jgi:hypothetical protein
MQRKTLSLIAAALLVALVTSSKARAWGGYHVGFTHVGYGGVHHYGRTGIYRGYGGARYFGGYHYGYGGYGGGYRYGYGRYGDGVYRYDYHYSPSHAGGYYGGGVRYGYAY